MKHRYLFYLGGLFLAAAVLFLAVVYIAPYMPSLIDFSQTFYPAIRYVLAGQNPYTAAYGTAAHEVPPLFFNPAWFLLILLPFGLLPFPEAQVLWGMFLIGVTLAAVWQLRNWGVRGAWTPALLLLPWSLIGILFGQPTAVVLWGTLTAIIQIYQRPQTRRSGFILLLAFLLMGVKPQMGLPLAIPLLLQLVWRRDRRLWIVGIGGVVIVGGTLWATLPYLLDLMGVAQEIAPYWQATLERELWLRQGPLWLATAVRLFIVGVMAWWAYRERGFTLSWWSAWLTAVLILTPYVRAYDDVLMLPLLAQLIVSHRWYFVLFVSLQLLYLFTPYGELGSVLAPLTAWGLFTLAAGPFRPQNIAAATNQ